ncbi:MAG: ABC transporter substrate-binding protein, partial [Planctomycetota bacterium]
RRPLFAAVLLAASVLALGACGRDAGGPSADRAKTFEALGLDEGRTPADLDRALGALARVPVDPPPRVGEDYHPASPPPPPFDRGAWETNPPPASVPDPPAKKGGRIVLATSSWPPTLRTEGPNSRLSFLSNLQAMIYESLLGYDALRQEFVPGLARYWQIDDDKVTFRFRMDPEARFADGREVTADDVVATLEHLRNPDRKDPLVQRYFDEIVDSVRMLDKWTVEIKVKKPRWRNLLAISGISVYPAAYIRMDGATYLEDWNWKLPPGTGPYEIRSDGIKKGRSITLHRRDDYWAKDRPENRGAYNFDEIEWQVVRDQELMYQKLLAGELDMYTVGRAQRWMTELDRERVVRMGWVQKRKIYSQTPDGFGGFCYNLRQPPFDSRNVRLAFAHLFNREKLFAKFFFYQYEYTDSYFPGQAWARPNHRRIRFDPVAARKLLAADGWTRRDAQGYLVNEKGERFPVLTLEFADQGWQRIADVVRHDLWEEAGIKMLLKLLDNASLLKKVWDYQFQLVYWNWTAGIFPRPEGMFHSKYADPKQTNNLNGFKNAEADRIMEAYELEFDPKKRLKMLQRLDEIFFDAHLYALGWYAPFWRIVYWDKFGHPPEYVGRMTRTYINVMAYWWYDPGRAERTARNMAKGLPNYPDSRFPPHQEAEVEPRWWMTHDLPMRDVPGDER